MCFMCLASSFVMQGEDSTEPTLLRDFNRVMYAKGLAQCQAQMTHSIDVNFCDRVVVVVLVLLLH